MFLFGVLICQAGLPSQGRVLFFDFPTLPFPPHRLMDPLVSPGWKGGSITREGGSNSKTEFLYVVFFRLKLASCLSGVGGVKL